jgi:hypothetical protein
MTKSKLSMKRKAEFLDAIMDEVANYIEGSDILLCCEDMSNWRNLMQSLDNHVEPSDILTRAMDAIKLDDNEMDRLMEPYYARQIDRSINLRGVTVHIRWNYKEMLKKDKDTGAQ